MYNKHDMRRIFLVALVGLFLIGIFTSLGISSVNAEDLSPDQTERVKVNCVSIKNSLSQLHASDALLRVNRGQVYESVATKLMDPFNTRLGSNRLDNKAMTTVTDRYRSALNTFRTDYISYEQKLSEAMRIDCTAQPNTFHTTLEEARKYRNTVHTDVTRLHRIIDDYRSSVSDFFLNYERVAN